MANIMSQLKLSNKASRNGFDLSKRNLFTAKAGELLPVYCKEVIPGDKFNINVKSFTRTAPLNTAAYTRIKEYYDWYFVPTNLLWNKFNTFVMQNQESVQHALNITNQVEVNDGHPFFTLEAVYDYVTSMRAKSLDLSKTYAFNQFGMPRWLGSEKLLDYLGYGSYYNTIEQSAGRSFGDLLGYEIRENPAMNPFPLLAYQKIYSDYYRHSQWESSNPSTYNVDYLDANSLEVPIDELGANGASIVPMNMFDLRYANWNKDLFMGVLPNSQFGDAASVDMSSLLSPSAANIEIYSQYPPSASTNAEFNSDRRLVSAGYDSNVLSLTSMSVSNIASSMGLTSEKLSSAFTVLQLRLAEAKQKLQEIQQSRQQSYTDQVEAIFNVKPSDILSERCMWLKGHSSNIDINEVVNTNLVSNGQRQAADIAGKGQGGQDGYMSFSSEVHGYLMCIYHAVPILDYNMPTRIQRQNLKTMYTDYANPVLDKTGMVQLPLIEYTNDVLNAGAEGLVGYVPRYYDYKTDVDEVRGGFRSNDFYGSWSAAANITDFAAFKEYSPSSISWQFFKVNPVILDSIFLPQVSENWNYETDQFLVNSYFDVKAVRPLDRNGLPY